MSEGKKVEFVKKEIDPEKKRMNDETIDLLKADGGEILKSFGSSKK